MNEEAKLAAAFPMLAESNLPIETLDLEVASRNSLRRSGIHTVAQLLQLTHTELVGLFPNRNLPFYSEIIYKLTCLAQPPKPVKTEDTCTVERLPDNFGERKMNTFNIFQVAGIWKSEEIHTRVIAELLNPNSQFHNMGTAFLQKFLVALGLNEDLSKAKIEDIEVKTEVSTDNDRRIDMIISTPNYYLPFEVKIWAKDQRSQLHDYYDYAKKQGKAVPCIYYLTPDGHDPSGWSLGGIDDELPVVTLSFQKDILPWLNDCITNTDQPIPTDVLEIMKQLRDNIRGQRLMCFSQWDPNDTLDKIYSELSQRYNLSWTECTDHYITCTLHKENNLEFALRVKKETKDSVSLYLICGITMEHEKPNYALAGPYIYDYPQEYKDLLSNTFSNPENVSGSTSKSTWNRLKGIDYKNQDGMGLEACLEKIEEIFSWLKDTPKKNCR